MNPNVPHGAAMLLDFIAGLETNRQGQAGYETIIGYRNEKPGALTRPITEMTLEELLAEQKRWVRNLKAPSGAAGRYQIIRPTLLSLIAELGVPLSSKFTPELQDRFGLALLQRRGWSPFAANTLSLQDFGNRLAREWASFPVLSRQQGAHRTVERGESYYAGDGINASLTKAGNAEAVLADVLNAMAPPPAPAKPTPAPLPTKPLPTKPVPPPKGWGPLAWSILGLVIAVGLVVAAFTLPLPF
ncbi:hypothetical protein VW23_009935 [Devosia insulae DS-56]|uniref:Glycoside hydrolase family 104 protein n=1 Tax=Devosia insulae DS-56 TaxID=1116389 RepID=A0A1E5XVZ0_9HYPH|nr:hypothetical protein [Devosia insulae]OEO32757.1 hypothetical protein VW23_009935 [Devosia insulae DS-56]